MQGRSESASNSIKTIVGSSECLIRSFETARSKARSNSCSLTSFSLFPRSAFKTSMYSPPRSSYQILSRRVRTELSSPWPSTIGTTLRRLNLFSRSAALKSSVARGLLDLARAGPSGVTPRAYKVVCESRSGWLCRLGRYWSHHLEAQLPTEHRCLDRSYPADP